DSGADIPPRSVVVVTSVETWASDSENESKTVLHVEKYGGGFGNVMVTGPVTMKAGVVGTSPTGWDKTKSFGKAFLDDLIYVSIDTGIADP
ncbi:hypothetical protein, partial [Klebsiella aerogenes]|uniref:hypothetical protein n=1 Tax=Klebsiella aerogenes TaxID=548 RepID=UPI001CC3F2B0